MIDWKGYNPPPVNKGRSIPSLTSPGNPGAFFFPSASPCNGPAFAPPLPRAAALPSALPLSPVRPLPPRPGAADKPRRPGRATSAALSLCRFPCPVPALPRAGLGKPRPARPPAALTPPLPPAVAGNHRAALALPGAGLPPPLPLAAGHCRPLTPPPVARPGRRPSAGDPLRRRRRKERGFTKHR